MMALQHASARCWRLSHLLAGFAAAPFESDLRIERLTLDSREAGPGALFLACRGTRAHGLRYAEQAAERGCAAIAAEPDTLWGETDLARLSAELALPVVPIAHLSRRAAEIAARFFDDPSVDMPVIGITGTNGKTSVGHFLACALATDTRCALIGSLGIGFPGELSSMGLSTPDPIAVQEGLARLRAQGADAVAMEVSSHALDQGRVGAVHFSHAVFTNLSRDHLDYHGDMHRYAAAKRRLFRTPSLQWAVLNHDDAASADICAVLAPNVRVARYSVASDARSRVSGLATDADLWVQASAITPLPLGLRVEIETSLGDGVLEVALIGRFNVSNLLAVLSVLLSGGLRLDAALERLRHVRGVPGRMECFGGGDAPLVVVDYAHTPDALEQAIAHLRMHCGGRLLTVFGCGGERDRGKRALMGAAAERLSDAVIITDDNPRGEDGDAICSEILAGMVAPEWAVVERQRALAIRRAIALAGRGDAVLVAGKGQETVQDMGELKVHFSDRAQVVQALTEWQGRGG
ncbi:MAG: UDP-N-acetylmuramoyl-L-alanyl-D-glutamate--2,6-diaminopimelate ligase [Thiohalocapsa sp.]